MRIVVTEEHIQRGEKGSRKCCAIALAAADSGCDRVSVGRRFIGYKRDGFVCSASLPAEARKFIIDFDSSLPVRPVAFNLADIEELYEDQC